MKIGITCYPTFGGSGVVATELGISLADRGDEVDLIAAVGQRDAELGRDDAAAAERRVAGDADLHGNVSREP